MAKRESKVAKERGYEVVNVEQAKLISKDWLEEMNLERIISFGLPEIDDRYHVWRVPLISINLNRNIGEVVIDAKTSLIIVEKSTSKETLEKRLLGRKQEKTRKKERGNEKYITSNLRNIVAYGDSKEIIEDLPAESVDLIFTSPPYFNARPEYKDYLDYEEYLLEIRKVIHLSHRVLNEGRFFIMNTSPVLLRRSNRNESSKRIAVPFDFHRLFIEEGFDFIDDIIWVKPEGAGWATGRGRRFAADRHPLQYKPVPVTEYVLVYRKHTDKLIDWNIRSFPDQEVVKKSKIPEGYEKTNIWYIKPAHHSKHPAVFPLELAEKVIRYYSFINDVVLDPFAGIGTVGHAAINLGRRFVLIDNEIEYVEIMCKDLLHRMGEGSKEVMLINCPQKILFDFERNLDKR